jgi:hypothetical protein
MVRIVQGMEPTVVERGLPVIVAQNPLETGKDADRIHGLAAPFGMGSKTTQPRTGNSMQPAALATDIDPGLVDMEQDLFRQRLFDPQREESEPGKGVPVEIDEGAAADQDTICSRK